MVKPQQVETTPRAHEAIQLTQKNAHEIAAWLECRSVTIRWRTSGEMDAAIFEWWPIKNEPQKVLEIGGWMLRRLSDGFIMTRTAQDFEKDYRAISK
jgi:hypothetical protein